MWRGLGAGAPWRSCGGGGLSAGLGSGGMWSGRSSLPRRWPLAAGRWPLAAARPHGGRGFGYDLSGQSSELAPPLAVEVALRRVWRGGPMHFLKKHFYQAGFFSLAPDWLL